MADEDGDEQGDDPFADLTFDEDFVRGADVVEPSAEARLARLRRIDEEHRRLAARRDAELRKLARGSHRSRWRSGGVVGFVVAALVGLGIWNVVQRGASPTVGSAGSMVSGDAGVASVGSAQPRPPAGVDASGAPLNPPVTAVQTSEAYRFMFTQAGTEEPVAYDPCRPIHVVVQPSTAPAGSDALLQEALTATTAATGLVFQVDGTTAEVPTPGREAYQPERYPGRWAPVLVAWSDPVETPGLDGDVAGLGGSSSLRTDDGGVYVTGEVTLDGPQLGQLLTLPDGRTQVRSVIQHELGHLVGLDHVEDRTQLMNPSDTGEVTSFAAGDLTGLARLGQGRCFPDV